MILGIFLEEPLRNLLASLGLQRACLRESARLSYSRAEVSTAVPCLVALPRPAQIILLELLPFHVLLRSLPKDGHYIIASE